jgi:signal transduction histidine kinase
MSRAIPTVRRIAADPGDFAPLHERVAYLFLLRAGLAMFVLGAVAIRPQLTDRVGTLVVVSLAYLALAAAPLLLRDRIGRQLAPLTTLTLLADGIYLAWAASVTGGLASPVRVAFFVQALVVTLVVSYRTGLKITAWDSLLIVLVAWPAGSGSMGAALAAAWPMLALLWLLAFITVTFSAIAERELRRQKADLAGFGEMGTRIESASAEDIPQILAEAMCGTFAFRRGLVLSSPEGDLRLTGAVGVAAVHDGTSELDRVVQTAWSTREPQLVKRLDADTDPVLAALLPDATNVVVAPLWISEGYRLGVVVLEGAPNRNGLRRWELGLLTRFAAHGALALNNAWLVEGQAEQLEEIRLLQRELKAQNMRLEIAVAERTADLERAVADLEATDLQRRRLLSQVVRAQEDERKKIANDLHDDPLQKLVSMKMRVELLMRTVDDEDLPVLRDVTSSCIRSLRYLLFDLRPPVLDEEGVGPAVERLLAHWDAGFGHRVHDDLLGALDPETRVILYRIAQEALANVRKHAEAANVDVLVTRSDGGVLLRVTDDGVGCDPTQVLASRPGHLGLAALRERTESAGGHCQLLSLPGAGTTFEAWLPASAMAEDESRAFRQHEIA